ncbi:MAG: hypothetical protein IPL79_15850 [Myxococcales bacterium]|nr:hypothetical protein [Myxococcales bacterium]
MAAVVVIQAWLQGPEGALIRRQVTMVTAERWREQRVLLATYTQCPDKTAPTLRVATYTWPISPAGTDPYGMWGIHVTGEAEQQLALQWLEQTAGSLRASPPPKRITDRIIASDRIRIATAEVLDRRPASQADTGEFVAQTPKAAAQAEAPKRKIVKAHTLPYGSGSMTDMPAVDEVGLTAEDASRDARQEVLANVFAVHHFAEDEAAVLLHLGRHGTISATDVVALVGTDAPDVWMNVLGRRLAAARLTLMRRDDQGGEPAWQWIG